MILIVKYLLSDTHALYWFCGYGKMYKNAENVTYLTEIEKV